MNTTIRKDILNILSRLLEDIRKPKDESVFLLRDLSNRTIHDASIFQDKDSTSIAVIIYAFSKLLEQGMLPDARIIRTIRSAYNHLLDRDDEKYRKRIKYIYAFISRKDSQLNVYIDKVITHACLKKGSRIHDHGISTARAAEILGLSQWELSNYIGSRRVDEARRYHVPVSRRLELARRLFEVDL
ncbi:MAG: hypothetical protein GXP63_04155 [DPANN group archaeon]|nr:hypothetical protein [DPANN group archaeon]